MKEMGRATIKDVAREAGVSLSTVNKALTGKKGISGELKQRVLEVAQRLDYKVNPLAGSLARNTIRIGVILPNDWEEYYSDICDGIAYEMERFANWKVEGVTLKYSVKDENAEQQALECVRRMNALGIRAVIFCHGNYLSHTQALAYAAQEKMDVICVGMGLQQAHPCFATIEVDARRCGRVAAELLEQCLPDGSSAAVIIGSKAIWPHREKVLGFSDRLAEGGRVSCFAALESGDDAQTAYRLTMELLQEPSVRGIFVATGAVEGVCRAVADSGQAGKIKIVATDLTQACVQYMKNGTVGFTIYQNTFLQGVTAVNMFYRYFAAGTVPDRQTVVPPMLFTKESLLEKEKRCLYTDVLEF